MQQIRCEAMNDNSMQCINTAFVKVNNVHYCRLHLNWIVGKKELDLDPEYIANFVQVLNPEDQKELDKIIDSGRVEEKAEVTEKNP